MWAGSLDTSISSGTLACMRNAISYWLMRVAISGSSTSSCRRRLSACTLSTTSRCCSTLTPERAADVQDGVAFAAKLDALKPAGQKSAVPLPRGDRLSLAEFAEAGQHHKARQIFAVAPEAVVSHEPIAGRPGDGRAGVHERVGRIVVDGFGVQRADDAQLVGHAAQLGKDVEAICWPDLPKRENWCCGARQVSFWPCSCAIGWPAVNDSGIG